MVNNEANNSKDTNQGKEVNVNRMDQLKGSETIPENLHKRPTLVNDSVLLLRWYTNIEPIDKSGSLELVIWCFRRQLQIGKQFKAIQTDKTGRQCVRRGWNRMNRNTMCIHLHWIGEKGKGFNGKAENRLGTGCDPFPHLCELYI